MSLGARATKGGAKAGGKEGKHTQDKGKTEKPQPKEKVKPQATTEQLRMAHMIDRKSEDASDVRRMVLELMEMTRRTEEEVCSALHDSDNDMVVACNLLLEESQRIQGEWQTSEKKKKKPPAPTGNGEASPPRERDRDREGEGRSRSGPRRRADGDAPRGPSRGAPRGRGPGRGASRAARGARRGGPPRPRAPRHEPSWDEPADTGGNIDTFPATEDWDNEEWSGSLSDTKVFTPSANAQSSPADADTSNTQEDWESPETNGPTESHIPSYTYHNPALAPPASPAAAHQHQPHQQQHHLKLIDQMGAANSHPAATAGPAAGAGGEPAASAGPGTGAAPAPAAAAAPAPAQPPAPGAAGAPPLDAYHNAHHAHAHTHTHQPMGMSGSLSAAQSQYLSQLTQQSQRHDSSVYTSNYGVYGGTELAQRKPQRARVPPPSKIPVSAVEMPGGGEAGGAMFLDVQFGALEPDALQDTHAHAHQHAHSHQHAHAQPQPKQQVTSQAETQPVSTSHETTTETPNSSYPNTNSMLSESLAVVDTTPTSQPVTSESIVTNSTSLEKQLSASMKQLSVSGVSGVSSVSGVSAAGEAAGGATGGAAASAAPHHAQPPHQYTQHHRPKTVGQQNVYAHHAVSHHPPVYGANVYAPQVNSTNASLTAASAMTATAYPSSVALTQYQPMLNSYQTSSSATVYGGSALYTAAPYTPYQPTPQPKIQAKDTAQYDSSVASSNSLTSTSTTQTSTAKVATTTVSAAGGASAGAGAGSGAGAGAGAGGYAAGALYGAAGASATYAAYDEAQMLRSTLPPHMGGYYEVGYGVSGGREGTFGLGAGERFSRTDAASPQQVPAAALPPGYAYFYQPPPTTYQYGVYPTYGGGSNVGGVGGVSGGAGGKLSTYAPQQPPYDAQDSYKPGGPYTGNASKSGGGAGADLTNAMYAKTHVALNKVNSYEKATFHSGTPPPFGAGSHLYIPAPPHHHHTQPHHHAPQQHQESGAGGGRSAAAKPPASKPAYSQSYWAPN